MPWGSNRDSRVEELLEAARAGDTERVLALLDAGLDVDVRGPINDTALAHATRGRHLALMQVLLDRGADPGIANTRCETPLTWALIQSGDWPRWRISEPDGRPLALLLAAGAKYRLYEAVLLNNLDLAQARLAEGADPNYALGSYHGSVLQIAAKRGFGAMARLLLDHGAEFGVTDDLGQTPLNCAARYGHLEVARLLLDRGAEVNARDWFGVTALTLARRGGHADVVRLLLNRGATWGIVDALERDDIPLFRTLVDAEIARIAAEPTEDPASVHEDDHKRRPALVDQIWLSGGGRLAELAASLGNLPALDFLLDRGATHLIDREDECSLLAAAAQHGQFDAIRLLIDRGADLHAVGEDGLTPLAWAMQEGYPEAVDLLRRLGATH